MGKSAESAIGIGGLVLQAAGTTAQILQAESARKAQQEAADASIAQADALLAQTTAADEAFGEFLKGSEEARDAAIAGEADQKLAGSATQVARDQRREQKKKQRSGGRSGTILTGPGGLQDEEVSKTLLGA